MKQVELLKFKVPWVVSQGQGAIPVHQDPSPFQTHPACLYLPAEQAGRSVSSKVGLPAAFQSGHDMSDKSPIVEE